MDDDDILILDCGSLFTKYGISSKSKSSDPLLLPSSFKNGQLEYPTEILPNETYSEYKKEFSFPLRKGKINEQDPELYFKLIKQIINNYVSQSSISNIFMTEQEISVRRDREILTEILFEQFDFNNVFLARKAACAIYESQPQSLTGIVLHSGDSYTCATAIYDGYPIKFPYKESCNKQSSFAPIGGLDLLQPLISALNSNTLSSLTAVNYTNWFNFSSDNFRSPLDFLEFTNSEINSEEKFDINYDSIQCTIKKKDIIEVMFSKEKNNNKQCNVIDLIDNSLEGIDEELKKQMLSNIVLSGGNTSHIGFAQKVEKEVKEKFKDKYSDIKVTESENISNFTNWIGADKMVKTQSFKYKWANREEYLENGTRIGDMKFI